jgi:hypothetical protein
MQDFALCAHHIALVDCHDCLVSQVLKLEAELARLTAYFDTLIAQAKAMEVETGKARAERDKANLQYREVVDAAYDLTLKTEPFGNYSDDEVQRSRSKLMALVQKAVTEGQPTEKPKYDHKLSCDVRDPATQPLGCNCGAAEKRKDEVSAGKCPECGLGIHGQDPLCEKHYGEYLGQNRARGNNEND